MKRKIYNKIKNWKDKWGGSTALMIDGARRVGKSWIAEEFAKNEYSSYILIDFNNTDEKIIELFEHYLTNLDEFFSRLSLYSGTELYPRKSVIVFDEVQLYPRARAALKYLVKDGRYDYIETGSLVSINHNVKDIMIPSEEMRIDMHPMDFEEYLWALGKSDIYDLVRRCYENKKGLGQSAHRSMMELIRSYILVGGMPQAVEAYVATKDFTIVDGIKRSILALYRNDISKYAGRQAARVTTVYDNIPGLLQQHEKKVRPSLLKKGGRMRDFSEALFWLSESRIINPCYAATEPSVSLSLNKDDSKVKLYMADTGLLISMAFESEQLARGIYEKILRGKLEFNKGMITENLMAQMLSASGHQLYFYSSYSRDNSEENMEIDFLTRKGTVTSRHNICPIEVKSSNNYTLISLEKFRKKYFQYVGESYLIYTSDLKVEDGITCIPLYMASLI